MSGGISVKRRIGGAFLVLLVFIVLLADGWTDGYNRSFQASELTAVKGTMSVADGETEAGLFSQGPGVSLPKGTYEFELSYTALAENSGVAVYTDAGGEEPVCAYSLPVAEEGTFVFLCQFEEEARNIQVSVNYSGAGDFAVSGLTIRSQGWVCTDVFAIALAGLALAAGWLVIRRRDSGEDFLCPSNIYLILTAAALAVSVPIFHDYVMGGGDVAYHLNRIEGIRSGLLDGQFPVRVHTGSIWGFGYGSSLFYPELLLYFPAVLRICGVSLVTAVKLYLVLINLLSGWLMYLAASRILGSRPAGLAAGLFYLTAIFRLGEGYIDAAYGQFSAMAFLPLLCLGVYELLAGDWRRWGYAVAGFTLVFQTHILSAVWSALFILAAALVMIRNLRQKERFLACLKAAVMIFLLNLWFLLPMVYMMGEPMNLEILYCPFTEYTVPFALLFKVVPEIGFSTTKEGVKLENVLPLTIGLALLLSNLLLPVSCMKGYRRQEKFRQMRKKAWALLAWGGVMVLFVSRIMPWKALARIPLLDQFFSYSQFPWRFLAFALVFLSMSGGAAVVMAAEELKAKQVIYAAAFLAALLPMASFLDGRNQEHVQIRQTEIIDSTMIASGEYLYSGTEIYNLPERAGKVTVSDEGIISGNFTQDGSHISFEYDASALSGDGYGEVPLLYYPGYKAQINGEEVPVERGGENTVRITLPAGSRGEVALSYQGKISWNLSFYISAASFLGWAGWSRVKRRRKVAGFSDVSQLPAADDYSGEDHKGQA